MYPVGELLQLAITIPGIVMDFNTLCKQYQYNSVCGNVTFKVFGNSPSPARVVNELSSNFNHSRDSRPEKASSLKYFYLDIFFCFVAIHEVMRH